MVKSVFLSLVCIVIMLLFVGCAPEHSSAPEIIGETNYDYHYEPIDIPRVPDIKIPHSSGGIPAEWYPPKGVEHNWKMIVIHHSASEFGNAAIFDDWHKQRNWKGVGYDFVICNGNAELDGVIETTFRWKEQIAGAHVGGTPNNNANVYGIGICLVGDFNSKAPTTKQMDSLVKLVKFLQQRYNIPTSNIYGHGNTPGYTGGTECPGKNFPMWQLKQRLNSSY